MRAVAGAFNNHSKGLEQVKRLHGGRLHTSAYVSRRQQEVKRLHGGRLHTSACVQHTFSHSFSIRQHAS